MKQSEKKKEAAQNVYSYRENRFLNEKPKRRFKRPLLQIGSFFGLLVLIWNLYAFSTYFIPDGSGFGPVSTKHLAVHNYLQSGGEAEIEITYTINSLVDKYNGNSLTPFHIEAAQQKLFELQKNLPLDQKRFAAMNWYYEECFSLAFQMTNILKLGNAPTASQELTYIIGKQTELSTRRDYIMIELLESEKMSYQQNNDGSISYEY